MRPGLPDRLRHPGDARRRGPPRRGPGVLKLLPAPLARRASLPGLAFLGLLLCAALTHRPALSNVGLGIALGPLLLLSARAARAGGDPLGTLRRTTPLHGPLGLLALLTALSALFSTDPPHSLVQLKGLFTFLLPLLVAALVDDEEDAGAFLDAFRLTALWLVGKGLIDYFLRGHDNVWDRASGGLSHYMTYAGLLMVLALALAARALSASRPRAARLADGAISAAAALLVGLTFTRSAALGLAAGAAVLLSTVRPRSALLLAIAAAALLAVSPGAVRERLSSSFDLRDDAAHDRVAMWTAGAAMIADRPFLGVGPGRVGYLYPVYRKEGFVDARVGHLHNNVVHTAAETGIPSALAYLALVALAAGAAWPLARDASRPGVQALARGALAVNAALFVAGLFEYNFGDVEVQRAMLVLLALPFAASRASAPREAPAS